MLSGTNCQAPTPKTDASSPSLVVVSLRAVRARGRVRRDALLGPHVALPVLGDAARLRLEVRDGRRALAVRGRPQRVPRVREEVERRGVRHDLQMRVRRVCQCACVSERRGEGRKGRGRKGKEMRRDRGAGRCGWRVWEEGKAWREGGRKGEGEWGPIEPARHGGIEMRCGDGAQMQMGQIGMCSRMEDEEKDMETDAYETGGRQGREGGHKGKGGPRCKRTQGRTTTGAGRKLGTWEHGTGHASYGTGGTRRTENPLTLLSQMAIELGSQWNRTWKSGFSLTNRTRSAASGVHEA